MKQDALVRGARTFKRHQNKKGDDSMKQKDKLWLDEATKMFQKRYVDPFWKPVLELHNQCNDEWREMNGEKVKSNILDAYDHATTGAKHTCNLLVEYLLESDMQGITLDPCQVMAVLDSILYLLHCDEQITKEVKRNGVP